jgi:hypothetical protein
MEDREAAWSEADVRIDGKAVLAVYVGMFLCFKAEVVPVK